MTQQERLKIAKDLTFARIKSLMEDFEQCGDYEWASLEEVEGEEIWTVLHLTAKKKFDIDEAVDEWEFKKKTREAKDAKRKEKST